MLARVRTALRRLPGRRSTRLTAEGFRFLLLTVVVGIAAINTGNNLFYLVLAMMLSLILVSGIMAELCLRKLGFHRHVPELLFAKEPSIVTLAVINGKSFLPSFSLHLSEDVAGRPLDLGLAVPQLLPGARRFLSYPLIAGRRGRLQFGRIRATTRFPFGLFIKQASYTGEGSTVVCPEIRPISRTLLQEVLAIGSERSLHRRGHGHDLYNLRLYRAGDDSRSIHWVSTARTSQLIVRETEAEDQRRATVVLSPVAPASHDDLFEEAVTCAASLLSSLSAQGYQLRLVVETSQSSFGQGDMHLVDLLRMLALCERRSPDAVGEHFGASGGWPSLDGSDGAVIAVLPWDGLNLRETLGCPDFIVDRSLLAGRQYAH